MLLFGKQPLYKYYRRILKNANDSEAVSKIIETAAEFGFYGNLWHAFLAYLIINDENAYTLSCERKKAPAGSPAGAFCNL